MNAPKGFSQEQQAYLQGLVLGSDVARRIQGLPILCGSAARATATAADAQAGGTFASMAAKQSQFATKSTDAQWTAEEKAKRQTKPEQVWHDIAARSENGQFPNGIDVFLSKYQGLFYVAPAQDAYMCRLRLPGGVLRSDQLIGLAELVDRRAAGHVDITTRANLQIREIAAKDAYELLMGLRDLGIVTLGAGADNIRNITCSPLSGIDQHELIETLPLARKLQYHILNAPALFDLPRKFNIAFDGGGSVSSLSETNDISWLATKIGEEESLPTTPPGIYFRLGLGGITGHGDIARYADVVATSDECIPLSEAILKVFIQHGDRTDRKRARLKYLLDAWGHQKFLNEVEQVYGRTLRRLPKVQSQQLSDHVQRLAHAGVHQQRQASLSYLGVFAAAGRLSSQQLRGIAEISRQYGSGHIRLTVWQNFIMPDVEHRHLPAVQRALAALQLEWNPSTFQAGLVACTGNAGCKFAAANTKSHSLFLAEYLQSRFQLDQPLNIHLTGCHHSCAQHAIGDIGLLATKVAVEDDMVEGYHVVIGGRTGADAAVGNVLVQSVPFSDIPALIERIIEFYLDQRQAHQSFAQLARNCDWQTFRNATTKFEGAAS